MSPPLTEAMNELLEALANKDAIKIVTASAQTKSALEKRGLIRQVTMKFSWSNSETGKFWVLTPLGRNHITASRKGKESNDEV